MMILIAVEGINGAGKTTFTDAFADRVKVNEPGRSMIQCVAPRHEGIGKFIRDNDFDFPPDEMALLMALDRLQQGRELQEVCKVAPDAIVISDRWALSSLAYQRLDYLRLLNINGGVIIPDLTIYLDIKPEAAKNRLDSVQGQNKFCEDMDSQVAAYLRYQRCIENEFMCADVIQVDAQMSTAEQVKFVMGHKYFQDI